MEFKKETYSRILTDKFRTCWNFIFYVQLKSHTQTLCESDLRVNRDESKLRMNEGDCKKVRAINDNCSHRLYAKLAAV